MKKRLMGESGDVHVYVNEQADVAILTMPVRDVLLIHALIELTTGATLYDVYCAIERAYDQTDSQVIRDARGRYMVVRPQVSGCGMVASPET